MKIKNFVYNLFFNHWHELRLWVPIAAVFMIAILVAVAYDQLSYWQCSNFERVTGKDTIYVNYDACYVQDLDGEYIRYNSKYKH